jgi:hypothetical protein
VSSEEDLEELVKEKVDELVEGKDREESGEQDQNSDITAEGLDTRELDTGIDGEDISRRDFLKVFGTGLGGLIFSSSVAGASLLSGTSIGQKTVWHAGNDGTGSGLDADTLDGKEAKEIGTVSQLSNNSGTANLYLTGGSPNNLAFYSTTVQDTTYTTQADAFNLGGVASISRKISGVNGSNVKMDATFHIDDAAGGATNIDAEVAVSVNGSQQVYSYKNPGGNYGGKQGTTYSINFNESFNSDLNSDTVTFWMGFGHGQPSLKGSGTIEFTGTVSGPATQTYTKQVNLT